MKYLLEYIGVLLLILECNSVYSQTYYNNYHLGRLCIICFSIVLILSILNSKKNKKNVTNIVFSLFWYYIFIIAFYLMNKVYATNNFINMFVILFPIMYFYYRYLTKSDNIKSILIKIKNIMCILSVLSLVFYVFGSLTDIIKPNNSIVINWGGIRTIASYYGLHFNTQSIFLFGRQLWRNTGVFPESPMFSLSLCIALAVELFINDKKSKKTIILLLITIFTTLSTTGIVTSSIMLIIDLFKSKYKDKVKKLLKYFMFPILLVAAVMLSVYFINEKKQTASYSTRLDDYKASYYAWKENPIMGTGYGNTEVIKNYMSAYRKDNQGLSNSIMVLLAESGIYLFVFYFVGALKTIKYGLKNKQYNVVIFTLIIILLFITTIFQYKAMMINFLAIAYALPNKRKELK